MGPQAGAVPCRAQALSGADVGAVMGLDMGAVAGAEVGAGDASVGDAA
ncbi:hypothetical protein [Streptomyces sp. NPDC046759]